MVKKTKTVLFGSNADPEMKKKTRKLKASGHAVQFQPNSHPDGTGPCGKICSCESYCKDTGKSFEGAFPDDKGPTMGMGY